MKFLNFRKRNCKRVCNIPNGMLQFRDRRGDFLYSIYVNIIGTLII